MLVDESTGEILTYESLPYKHGEDFPKTVFLSDVRSVDDMEDFMKHMVDKRKIRGSNTNDLLHFFESCLGHKVLKHGLFGHIEGMSVPQYRLLDSLGKIVQYKNVIMTTRKDLCSHLKCRDDNLMKKLRLVDPYIKIYTQDAGIRKGEIKILINPKFFYIYDYDLYDLSRNEAVKEWYGGLIRAKT